MDKINFHDISEINDVINKISCLMKNGELDIEISYFSNFSSTKNLRDIINHICFLLKISNNNIYKITLIIDELNNNAIEYWSMHWDINKLRFKAKKNNKNIEINIEVEDSWKWNSPKKTVDMEDLRVKRLKTWYSNHNSIRWRWLFLIILKIVDLLYFWDSKSWGLIVWIKKTISI